MIERITEEEIDICECFHIPRCLIECLFHNFDNMADFDEKELGNLRKYQLSLLSDEVLIDFDATAKYHGLNPKEKFQLKKNVGDIYCLGGRKFGKSLIVLILDMIVSMTMMPGTWAAFASANLQKIRQVLDRVKIAFESHPILRLWRKSIKSSTSEYKFLLKNNYRLESVNFKVGTKNQGNSDWYGTHVDRVYIEEASLETDKVAKARKDALSEFGAVFRISGMTNFTKYSPAGKVFYDQELRNQVVNYPQYVNPYWDEKEKQDRVKEYGGEQAISYRVFVKGEVVEDGVSAFDMEKVRRMCYPDDNKTIEIKAFEINKLNLDDFENTIIVTRPKSATRIFISADIGESGGTEIVIHSEIVNDKERKYRYLYNICLLSLTDKQQAKIFRWLINQFNAEVIALDCGEGTGRAIYRSLLELFPKKNFPEKEFVWYDGSKKVIVGYEKDEKNVIILRNGRPVPREESMSLWSVKRLKDLLYEGKVFIPTDYKFDMQFNSVVTLKGATKTLYQCVSENDHLFDAWKVFGIAQWQCSEFDTNTNKNRKPWGLGV